MKTPNHFSDRYYAEGQQQGPISFLNPTTSLFPIKGRGEEGKQPKAYHVWRSRDNRKGRHAAAAVAEELAKDGKLDLPPPTNTWRATLRGIWRMVVKYPVWDISYDVAIAFTLGSVVWCINGPFMWLPVVAPWTEFDGEVLWGGGITAFIGATVFEVGSVLMMLEAVNENRGDCFGWALESAVEDGPMTLSKRDGHKCRHHHAHRRSLLKARVPSSSSGDGLSEGGKEGSKEGESGKESSELEREWDWWPSWRELRTHYLREIGFLACLSQFLGATVFWISGFTGLPPIYESLSTGAMAGVYWAPQVIGGTGFIVSALLFMLEVQRRWYIPNLKSLGWHMGFWNLIGAIGFTLCGAFGFGSSNSHALEYAATLSTFIGSWAFLIGSIVQWYESLNKFPMSVEEDLLKLVDSKGGSEAV